MNYNIKATKDSLDKTILSLTSKGYKVHSVETKDEALEKIQELIPNSVSVMNGSSTTLAQIGFIDLLKSGNLKWNNLHEKIVLEKNPEIQTKLRNESTLSDYYLGSVHALTENGEFIVASNTGSQLPNIVFSSKNLIFVIGVQKIVKNLSVAMDRLENYVKSMEDVRSKEAYGVGTAINKIVIFNGENPMMGRTIDIILVDEVLGF